MIRSLLLSAGLIAALGFRPVPALAQAAPAPPAGANGCPSGSYSVIQAPDGSAVSILFDAFSVSGGPAPSATPVRRTCNLQIPVRVPPGYSAGVYRIDYRGYARLAPLQYANVYVGYGVGDRTNARLFRHGLSGGQDGDFAFTENLGGMLMWRMGCGQSAVLNVTATLEFLPKRQPGEALVMFDTLDGDARPSLTYGLDLQKCAPLVPALPSQPPKPASTRPW
jgi:hypothetical protein